MPGDLKGALNDILRSSSDERPTMPSPVSALSAGVPPRRNVSVRVALLIAIVFAVVVFIAVRPILSFRAADTATTLARFQYDAIDEPYPEYRDPLFQPFVD